MRESAGRAQSGVGPARGVRGAQAVPDEPAELHRAGGAVGQGRVVGSVDGPELDA